MKARTWTPGDDIRLREGVAAGLDDVALATLLGRSHGAIKQRRAGYALRLIRHVAWTDVCDARLRMLMRGGSTIVAAARDLGTTVSRVKSRMTDLGLCRRPHTMPEQIVAACELIESGLTPTQVSRRIGMSVALVEYYARRDGAVNGKAYALRAVRPYDDDLVALSTAGHCYAEIGRRLGIGSFSVRCRLRTLARREAILEARAA